MTLSRGHRKREETKVLEQVAASGPGKEGLPQGPQPGGYMIASRDRPMAKSDVFNTAARAAELSSVPGCVQLQIFQGGFPDCHNSSKTFFSLSVSMHDQNP
jgi:hypothetical protein